MNPNLTRIMLLLALVTGLTGLAACAGARGSAEPRVPRHPLTRWHRTDWLGKPWRLTPLGVEVRGAGVERTEGKPVTVTWIWENHHRSIERWSAHYQVPAELVIALIATESVPAKGSPFYTRDPRSLRRESGFVSVDRTPHRLAVGLTQITVGTARAVLGLEQLLPATIDDQWLMVADNNIRAGTALAARQARGQLCNVATLYDPPVVFAAYNAGGLYRMGGRSNRWKMRQYPSRTGRHLDRGVAFFNDAVAVLRVHRLVPSFGYRQYLYHLPRWPE